MSNDNQRSIIPLTREGERFRELYRIEEGGVVKDVDAQAFDAAHRINGIIRVLEKEYFAIDVLLPFFTHFNLEFCGHKIGARYALPKIVARGYYRNSDDEVPPTLSFDGVLVGVCTVVREHVPYSALRDEDFRYSMKHIQNVDGLKKAIIARYSVSIPNLSEKEILDRSVSVTTLRFGGVFE